MKPTSILLPIPVIFSVLFLISYLMSMSAAQAAGTIIAMVILTVQLMRFVIRSCGPKEFALSALSGFLILLGTVYLPHLPLN